MEGAGWIDYECTCEAAFGGFSSDPIQLELGFAERSADGADGADRRGAQVGQLTCRNIGGDI